MKPPIFSSRTQNATVFVTMLLFELVLLMIQIWLFVSALDGVLSGRRQMSLPAAIASVACLAINCWMLVGIYRVDHER